MGYFTFDKGGLILEVNLTGADLLGVERDNLIRKPFIAFVSPEFRYAFYAHTRKVFADQTVQTCELKLTTKNGTLCYVSVKSIAVKDDRGNSSQYFSAISDITDRKKSEDALKFQNIILSTQNEVSIDGIMVVDENGSIISYNKRFMEIWGIPHDLIVSKDDDLVLQYVATKPVDPEGFLARARYLYEHKDEKSHEEIALKDGRTLDRYSAPMFGADGRYFGRVWYFRDITFSKQVEDELRKISRAMEQSPASIMITDLQGILSM